MLLLIVVAVVIFLLSALLVLLVFLQNPKGQGSNSMMLGSGVEQMVGVAHSSHILEKATYVLAGLIFSLTLFIAFRIEQKVERVVEDSAITTRLEAYAKQGEVKQED